MLQDTIKTQYAHEGDMHAKSWLSVPYNYFIVIVYLAMGIAFSLHPSHRITQQVAEALPFVDVTGRTIGQFLGTAFLLLSFVLWQHEPRGKWVTWATLPAAVWACYTIVNILGNDSSSWVTGVMVAAFVGALVYNAELRQTLENNEVLNQRLIKEGLAKDALIEELRAKQVSHD